MKEIILIVDDEEEDVLNFKDHISDLQTGYYVEAEDNFSKVLGSINRIIERGDKVVAAFVDICEKKGAKIRERGLDTISVICDKFSDIFVVAYTQYGNDYINMAYERGAHFHQRKQTLKKELTFPILKSKIEDHKRKLTRDASQYKNWNIDVLVKVLKGISDSMGRITYPNKRYSKRNNIYEINDEYDLQDLLWLVLKPIFPRLTDEDPISKIMGKASRADFYIPEIKSILELKHVKRESHAGEIPKQLDNDITWYGAHPEAERLFFYVFKESSIKFDFMPLIHELNKNNYQRNSKKWELIKCVIGRKGF